MERNDSTSIFDINNISLKDEQNNPIDAGQYLEEVEGYIAIVIPENFTQKLLFNSPINLAVIIDENSQQANIALKILDNVIYSFNLGVAGYNDTQIGMESTNIFLEEDIDISNFLFQVL